VSTEGPTNELLKRMLAAIAQASSREDVERLIETARAQAESEVAEMVKSAIKASLLREVIHQLESDVPVRAQIQQYQESRLSESATRKTDRSEDEVAPPPPGPTACYVYAITRDLPDDWSSDTPAIDPACRIYTVGHRDLQAVVSNVPLNAFNQAALDERLAERQWLEEKVRAHDDVVKSVAETATAIPCRFCTIVRGPEDVKSLLAAHYQSILDTITKLDGREEWGVRINFDPTAVAHDEAAPVGESSGKQYLQQRKQHDARRAESHRKAREIAQQCHETLSQIADDANLLAPRTAKGPGVELVNAAYLVRVGQIEQFHQAMDELRIRYGPDGLEFVLTGPWPPYNFARLDLSLEAAA